MNKWLIGLALVCMTFAFAYTLPVTIKNPTLSNIVISSGMGIVILMGLYLFSKKKPEPPVEPEQVEERQFEEPSLQEQQFYNQWV